MTIQELRDRVVETTGLDVMTIGSIQAAISNCMADLTARGYKTFQEKVLSDFTVTFQDNSMLILPVPATPQIRKILYCKLFFTETACQAKRYSINNNRVGALYSDGKFRTHLNNDIAAYYIKGDKIYVEWSPHLGPLQDIEFGYFSKLIAPVITNLDTETTILEKTIDIREEFEDALVFYAAYFYYARYIKDVEKIQFYLSQYKYYVEDITHELAYEDEYYDEDSVIREE